MKLYKHQEESIDKMIERATGFMNFSEMGTGKTPATIVAATRLLVDRVLVVCLNSLKMNWESEWLKWASEDWNVFVIKGSKKNKESIVKCATETKCKSVVIINYEMVAGMFEQLKKYKPSLIICDEVHSIKSHTAKKTKALKKIPSTYKWGLTGTPTPNSPLDIWSLYDWIRPGYLSKSFYGFRSIYADVYTGAGFPIIRKFRNIDEASRDPSFPKERLLQPMVSLYSYRITKDECLDLPDKIFQDIFIELDPSTKKIYRDMLEDMVASIGTDTVSASTALVKLLRLQQITSGFIQSEEGLLDVGCEKLNALEELLDSLCKEKVVVWCRFIHEIHSIQNLCKKNKRKYFLLYGEVSIDDRNNAVKDFNTIDEPSILIANMSVGGVGLNLTGSRYAIYFSRSFSYGDYVQSVDRQHRIGQKHKVTYYNLMCKGTVDEYIGKILEKKQDMMSKITGDDIRKIGLGCA